MSQLFRGLWYSNQKQEDAYGWKYSGGLATYPQQILPLAVHSATVARTYFCYAGADADNCLENSVAYFDHTTGEVSDPVVVLRRQTNDAHYNSCIALAPDGHLLVVCNSHGNGVEIPQDDPTRGKAYIFRSVRPHDISSFESVYESNFSYSQMWPVAGGKLVWLHTRYEGSERPLYVATSSDGIAWSEPRQIARMARGSYQVSWPSPDGIVTAFDYHPEKGGLNARTNIYYLQSIDGGETWLNDWGHVIELPLTDPGNPARIAEFEREGVLIYLKDIAFDGEGHPHILYVSSHDCWSGPSGGPRELRIAMWRGDGWSHQTVCPVDHNYDHGSLWIDADGRLEIIAPTAPGPQPWTTGGEVEIWESTDGGECWKRRGSLTPAASRQHTYVRKPLHGHPDFWAFWADGDALVQSSSKLYVTTRDGRVRQLE